MDYYLDQIVDDWTFQQTDSTLTPSGGSDAHHQADTPPRWSIYPSGYAHSILFRSNSAQQHQRKNGGIIARPELISTAPNGLAPLTPRRSHQAPSVAASDTFNCPDCVFHGQPRQNYPSPASDYHEVHHIGSQNNSIIESPYDNQQWQQPRSATWSSPPPLYLVSPTTSTNAFGLTSLPESDVHVNAMSSPSISQPNFLPSPADHEISESKDSVHENFPLPCYWCDDIIQDGNVQWVHYWTKHPPLAGSPGAWKIAKCLWKGCRTKTNFATPKSWIVHVNYVHQKGHKCPVATCRAKPFGSPADLERHRLTKHVEPIFCLKLGCQARKRTNLRRKDKLEEHEATWHGQLMCEVPDCPRRRIYGEDHGFSKPSKLEEHKRQKHRHLRIWNSGS